MSKPTKKRRAPAKRTKSSKKRTARVQRPSTTIAQPSPEHQAAYIETLIETGQAAPLTKEGKLPAGATHKIVKDEQGRVKVVRRRFSIS